MTARTIYASSPMNQPRKRTALSAFLALAVALLVTLGVSPSPAAAGTYWNTTNCAHHAYTKFICYDASAGTVVIQYALGAQTGYTAGAAFTPTKGYIAFDVFECNASAPTFDTGFTTPGYYGIPTAVHYVVDDGGPPAAGNIYVSQTAHDLIAWLANSQTGYPCFVVP